MKGTEKYPRDVLDPALNTGLILCGMGGPDGPDAVEPFLRNLFRDPAIFPLPRLIAPLAGWLIAKRRSGKVAERYQLIDPSGATPQLKSTRDQSRALAELLHSRLSGSDTDSLQPKAKILPGMAMRYWNPFPVEAVTQLLDQGAEQFLIVPTYPQFSGATSGSTLDFVLESVRRLAPKATVHAMPDWHLLEGYIHNLALPVIVQLGEWAEAGADPGTCALVYAAHSLPESFIKQGDPYESLTRATVAAVQNRVRAALTAAGHTQWLDLLLSDPEYPLAFQSKVGPVKWLGPDIKAETRRLASAGCQRLMVQPVSFACEHIETIVELDMELQDLARAKGITEFRRGPALCLQPEWLESLAAEIAKTTFAAEVEPRV